MELGTLRAGEYRTTNSSRTETRTGTEGGTNKYGLQDAVATISLLSRGEIPGMNTIMLVSPLRRGLGLMGETTNCTKTESAQPSTSKALDGACSDWAFHYTLTNVKTLEYRY